VSSDLSFVALSVTQFPVLDRFAQGTGKVKPDLRLDIDVDINPWPELIARRGILRCCQLIADRERETAAESKPAIS